MFRYFPTHHFSSSLFNDGQMQDPPIFYAEIVAPYLGKTYHVISDEFPKFDNLFPNDEASDFLYKHQVMFSLERQMMDMVEINDSCPRNVAEIECSPFQLNDHMKNM